MPQISVIIPVYNRGKLITRAINSVLNQTFEDFELIIVDDGSTDVTVKIIKEEYQDERIQLFVLKTNKGGSAARNIGIENSSGRYIAFLDSDDEWMPTKLEKQLAVFNSQKLENLGAVGCGRKLIIQNDGTVKTKNRIPEKLLGNLHRKLLTGKAFPGTPLWPGGTSTIMIKKECFEKIGNFDINLRAAQEHDLYIRLSKFYQFAAVPEVLINYYIHSGDKISTSGEAQILGKTDFLEKYHKEIPSFSFLRGNFLYNLGIQYMKRGEKEIAKKYLIKSVIAYPFELKHYFYFIKNIFS